MTKEKSITDALEIFREETGPEANLPYNTERLIAIIDQTLQYFYDVFAGDNEVWQLPICGHSDGISPNELVAIRQQLNQPDTTYLIQVIADIREKSGVGDKPMLSELADTIKRNMDNEEKCMATIIAERDDNCDAADVLAHKLAQVLGVDIGEHSNLNDPWQNAIDYANALLTKTSAFVRNLEDRDEE